MDDNLTIEIPEYDEISEDLNRPSIPEGTFMAVVTDVKIHSKKDDPSKQSVKWSLTLNLGDAEHGWDSEGRTQDLFPDYYTPLGRIVETENGPRLEINKRGYGITDRMARALGVIDGSGKLELAEAIGRTVLVTIKHEEDNRQTPEEVEAEGQRWNVRVQRVSPYRNADGILAPKLEGVLPERNQTNAGGDIEF